MNRFIAIISAIKLKIMCWGVAICFGAGFVLDVHYAHNPRVPIPAQGFIYPHPIKSEGNVYLTASEYAPYIWINYAIVGCLAMGVLAFAVEAIAKKKQR